MNKTAFAVLVAVAMGVCCVSQATLIEGFEGGLGGLDYTGSLSLTSALGPLSATEDSTFALLTNGPGDIGGDAEPDFSYLTIDFLVDPLEPLLLFDYDFLTAETTSLNGGPYAFDFFSATLDSILLTDPLELLYLDTGETFSYLVGQDVFLEAPDGSLFDQETGLNTLVFEGLDPLAGEMASLVFQVGDELDGSFDSGVFLDNIRTESRVAKPVPEPATITLMCGGLLGLFAETRRRRNKRL